MGLRCGSDTLQRSLRPLLFAAREYHALVYRSCGDPHEVLHYENLSLTETVKKNMIRVKMLAAPINPADINTIEGTYPLKPHKDTWPYIAIAGHEGVGRVEAVGAEVQGMAVNDHVVPLIPHQGTWREEGVFVAGAWHKVPNDIPVDQAAAMSINPPTALCMLEDFVPLKEGDVVVQNGATGAVGQALIQIARAKGIRTVNIIRSRPDFYQTAQYLKSIGAGVVATVEGVVEAFKMSGLPLASLGLNCIGGKETETLTKLVKKHATIVTYGGMSKAHLSVPTSAFIFKDLTFRGFWWSGHASAQMGLYQKSRLIDQIGKLIQSKQLTIRNETFAIRDYKEALKRTEESYRESKVVLVP